MEWLVVDLSKCTTDVSADPARSGITSTPDDATYRGPAAGRRSESSEKA